MQNKTDSKVRVLHLRQASGGGGGADTVLMDWLRHIDPGRFHTSAAYMQRSGQTVSPILERLSARVIPYQVFPGRRGLDPVQILHLRRFIKDQQVRILHCHCAKSDVIARLLGFLTPGLRLATTLHAWHTHSWRSGLYKRLDLMAVRSFHLVTAVSREIAGEAEAAGVSNVQVLTNGVDLDLWPMREERRSAGGPFTVGFAGRLSREKGIKDFVRVARKVTETLPEVRFLIAGEGPDGETMRSMSAESGLAGQFEYMGLLSREEIRDFYDQLDLLLHPSHSEGTPLSLLEAAARGVPVVATLAGGVGDLFCHGETALLEDPGNVNALAKDVLCLLRDSSMARRLAGAARNHIEQHFNLRDRIRTLETHYLRLIGEAP